jgi:hypothetical protein
VDHLLRRREFDRYGTLSLLIGIVFVCDEQKVSPDFQKPSQNEHATVSRSIVL